MKAEVGADRAYHRVVRAFFDTSTGMGIEVEKPGHAVVT
jgi:hypothetical protein